MLPESNTPDALRGKPVEAFDIPMPLVLSRETFMNPLRILLAFFLAAVDAHGCIARAAERKPNIIFLLADDLGYGDVGAFGQKKIRTPNIDRLAAEGMKLTQHYAGNNVCAPSRCVLMTGKHPGHAFIRDNRQAKAFDPKWDEGQTPVPEGELTFPLTLKKAGYKLGGFGKWGLGPVGSTGDPLKQGFDRFFGYNCQAVAHNYYPTHLWDNDKQRALDNPKFSAHQKLAEGADVNSPDVYAKFSGNEYAPDLISAEAREFIQENKDRPFFLYYPTTVPHLALQVPEDSLAEYAGKFPEEPYDGSRGYLPHRAPRAAYAAMVTRMDREIGRIADLIKELGLDENTIFVFSSDNGPLYDKLGGTDAEFFESAGPLNGRKGSMFEGGIREATIVRWKGHIAEGTTSDRVSGFEDWMPTLLELAGEKAVTPADIDGISMAPTLLGKEQDARPFLYRESPGYGGQACIRVGSWKVILEKLHPGPKAKLKPRDVQLFDLANDIGENNDVAEQHPDIVEKLTKLMQEQHVKSDLFPIRALDGQ